MSAPREGDATALAAHGYVPLEELGRGLSSALYRAAHKATRSVLVQTRPARGLSGYAALSAETEFELLKHLCTSGATLEPLAWFCKDGLDVLVFRDEPSEGLVICSDYIRRRQHCAG